jgi:peptidoglycan hydrolase-like protein with peptidoglycan-binding domain
MRRTLRSTRLILLPLLAVGLGASPFSLRATTISEKPVANKPATSSVRNVKATGKTSAKSGASSGKKSAGKAGKSSKRSRREVGQKAPTADRVSEIQQALAKNGSYAGTPNGQWDGSTVDAMKKFQGTHGLNPSGRLDAKTLEQLGLGSKTAGVGAPAVTVKTSLLGAQHDVVKTGLSDQ